MSWLCCDVLLLYLALPKRCYVVVFSGASLRWFRGGLFRHRAGPNGSREAAPPLLRLCVGARHRLSAKWFVPGGLVVADCGDFLAGPSVVEPSVLTSSMARLRGRGRSWQRHPVLDCVSLSVSGCFL